MRQHVQITRERWRNNHLTVKGKLFQMGYPLPTGFGTRGQNGYVKLLDLPVSANLTRRDILRDCAIGLGTSLKTGTRTFIERWGRVWLVRLGQMCVECSTSQAEEACACVDAVGQAYLEALREATDLLGLWDYPPVRTDGIEGVVLLVVPAWLWDAMLRCSFELTHDDGTSSMHVFDGGSGRLGIRHGGRYMSAALWPVRWDATSLPGDSVALVYEYPDLYFEVFEEDEHTSWKTHIGPEGFWTAPYTENWLVERFIPLVLSRHASYPPPARPRHLRERLALALLGGAGRGRVPREEIIHRTRDSRHVPLPSLSDARQLLPYLTDLQAWFHNYPVLWLPATLLPSYYRAMTDLTRSIDTTGLDLAYVEDNVRLPPAEQDSAWAGDGDGGGRSAYERVLSRLEAHVARIAGQVLELHQQADYLTRAWLFLLREGQPRSAAAQLAEVASALEPLWEQCRLECRYCLGVAQ